MFALSIALFMCCYGVTAFSFQEQQRVASKVSQRLNDKVRPMDVAKNAANPTQSKLHWQVTVLLLMLLLHLTWSRTNRTMACNTHESSRIPHNLEFATR
ncbi:hypothetical protein ACLKA7_003404 [Drosophila subpalustris]